VGRGYALDAPAGAEAHAGRELVWGARPQDLTLSAHGALRGAIDAIERLGSDGFVYVKTDAGTLAARFEGAASLKVGEPVAVAVAPGSIFFFDAQSGEALPLQSAPALAVAP
jgi:multiple sugar transport system ATP-binding protein